LVSNEKKCEDCSHCEAGEQAADDERHLGQVLPELAVAAEQASSPKASKL
jgi:hypothetical protein